MLEKTIKQILTKKVSSWLDTITDIEVKIAISRDLVITGGCFTSMILSEEPKDYDCYFKTKETTLLVAHYYRKLWNNKLGSNKVLVLDGANPFQGASERMIALCPPDRIKLIMTESGTAGDPEKANGSEELGVESIAELDETLVETELSKEKQKFFPVFISTNAITLSDGIQIVVRFYGEPEKIHETYDFVHTKAYWTSSENKVVIPAQVYEHTINKVLMYTGSKYPICSLFRMRKFITRGWKINVGQILKMCMQVSELDLMDIDTLEDQLIGVDSLYFVTLINKFREMKVKDPKFELSVPYLLSIIDQIF